MLFRSLTLLGTFAFNPLAAATATFVMILAAAYLLWMFQRVFLGELSGFLGGLGSHLTDITPVEILTLAPLGALVVAFGLFPGILLDIIDGSVTRALSDVGTGEAIAIDPLAAAIALGALAAVIVLRIVTLPMFRTSAAAETSA